MTRSLPNCWEIIVRKFKGWVLRKFYPDVASYIIMRIQYHPDVGSKYLYDEYELDRYDAD